MMITQFWKLRVGATFSFRARRYEKMNSEVGRDEDRGGNVFHPRTEVVEMQSGPGERPPCRVRSEKPPQRDPNWWLPPLRPVTWHGRRSRPGRLGREPGRELRPYGTL